MEKSIFITVTSHECHGVSNQRQRGCLFYQWFKLKSKGNVKLSCLWPFARGIRWLMVNDGTLLFKSNGIFLRWQNMVFIFKVQSWNFVCGIRRSFAFTMENILSVWYTATPGWTSKFGRVWKTRCQNAATWTNIWRCFLVSWDDKYLWVMGSNNRHELYFIANYYDFPVYIVFLAKYGI